MHAATLLFLNHLFSRCQGLPAAMTLTAIHPDGRHRTPSRHIPVGQTETIDKALDALQAANTQGWGAYIAVGLRRPGLTRWQRGGLSDVVALPALFVDIDNPSEVMRQRLRGFSPAPSILVHSGGGYHAYWLLEEPMADLSTASRLLVGLATHLGGDHLSPATSLRLPGTRNTKPERAGMTCQLLDCTDHTYQLSDFMPLAERNIPPCRSPLVAHSTEREQCLNSDVINAIVQALYMHYRARKARGGWIPALCPCGHARDSPGAHFFFNPDIGCGRCHGRHGTLRLTDLCSLLGIDAAAYGGIFKRKDTSV
ncbi:MAG TPA: DNA-primase RepB domain-containing protein [Aggregatilineales bacterium]|nr:DNA-primase RepB domain-containing protein [Aggregatilineales bacterium]